jgi:hypothetical protein
VEPKLLEYLGEVSSWIPTTLAEKKNLENKKIENKNATNIER